MKETNDSKESLYVFLLAVAQFIHLVDYVIIMPLGPRFMSDFSITPGQFGSLVSSYNFAAGIAAIIFGTFADKFDKKKLLVVMLFGLGGGTLLCGFAKDFESLLIGRILAGSFGGMVVVLLMAIITDIVPYERRGRAMGALMTAFSVASVIGLPLGLWIADEHSWELCFIIISLLTFIVSFIIGFIFPSLTVHAGSPKGFEALKNYYEFIFVKGYGLSFIYIFTVSFSLFLVIPFLAPYAVKNMGIAVDDIKYMYLVGGLFTILTSWLVGKLTDRWGALRSYLLLAIIAIIPVYLYTTAGIISMTHYLIIGTFFMIMVSGRMIPSMTLISAVPKPEERGGFMGVVSSLRSFGSASATFVGGIIVGENVSGQLTYFEETGYFTIFVIIISCMLAFLLAKKRGLLNT